MCSVSFTRTASAVVAATVALCVGVFTAGPGPATAQSAPVCNASGPMNFEACAKILASPGSVPDERRKAHYWRGVWLDKSGDYSSAELEHASRFALEFPDKLPTEKFLTMSCDIARRGAHGEALAFSSKVVADYPNLVSGRYSRARTHGRIGDGPKMTAACAEIVGRGLTDGQVAACMGFAKLLSGDPKGAVAALAPAVADTGTVRHEALLARGMAHLEQGDGDLAMVDFVQLSKEPPHADAACVFPMGVPIAVSADGMKPKQAIDATARYGLAIAKFMAGDVNAAAADLDAVIASHPQFTEARVARVATYAIRGDFDKSRAEAELTKGPQTPGVFKFAVRESLLKEPTTADGWLSLAEGAELSNRWDDAIKFLSKAIALEPGKRQPYVRRAWAYDNLGGNAKLTLADLDKAQTLGPGTWGEHANRARALSDLGQADAALIAATKAIELAPKESYAYRVRANIQKRQEKFKMAASDIATAVELSPTDAAAWQERGSIAWLDDRNQEALEHYKKSLELNPRQVDAFVGRANVHLTMKKRDLAIADYTSALAIAPQNRNVLEARAVQYYFAKQYDKTIEDCTRRVAMPPVSGTCHTYLGA
ncbi:MAG: tetratricopeptide repeat protein, partial [Hyphomicrobiaceae bacterium]|nr:tetratricopeptide repeat protein [Hyphomicrobiaceae bacterium]